MSTFNMSSLSRTLPAPSPLNRRTVLPFTPHSLPRLPRSLSAALSQRSREQRFERWVEERKRGMEERWGVRRGVVLVKEEEDRKRRHSKTLNRTYKPRPSTYFSLAPPNPSSPLSHNSRRRRASAISADPNDASNALAEEIMEFRRGFREERAKRFLRKGKEAREERGWRGRRKSM
ncbi:hypothetical protein YB2330_006115 [Saitoella coloradoensis]